MSITKTRWNAILIIGLAALLRLLLLGIKPPHFDEGVNGWFVDQITKTGYFHYDPTNYHGPLHFYVLFLSQTLLGRNVWALRLPIVAVSTATVGLVLLFDRFIARRTSELAALAMALSPAAVFYGRYAIHESWLVFFLVLTLFGMMGLWRFGAKQYLWAVTIGLTGMVLTKETYIIHILCFVLAAICLRVWEIISPSDDVSPPVSQAWTSRDLTACILVGIGLIVFFYSGGFLDFSSLTGISHWKEASWKKLFDDNPFVRSMTAWKDTGASGHGHEKPFYYWLQPLILRYEWVALVGLAASFYFMFPRKSRLMRYIAIYGCGALVAYSIVHYKTPWCIISLLWPFFFLFGGVAAEVYERFPRLAVVVCAVSLSVATGWTITLNFFRYTDENEPYVYVQTLKDISKLTSPLKQLTIRDPSNYHLNAHILADSYHPLPWVLGDFTGIGYYGEDRKPENYDADFLLVEPSRVEEVENELREDYFVETLKLRASQDPLKLYLNVRRFGALYPDRPPDFVPAATEPSLNAE